MRNKLYNMIGITGNPYDGQYYTAVSTTGVFCNISCSAKKPLKDNITFYSSIEECIAYGFRACKKCKPLSSRFSDKDNIVKNYTQWLEKQDFPEKSYLKHPIENINNLNIIKKSFQKNLGFSLGKYIRMKRCNYIIRNKPKSSKNPHPLDISYIDTPIGIMLACFSKKGLTMLEYIDRKMLESQLKDLEHSQKGYFILKKTAATDDLKKQLHEYFHDARTDFDISLDFVGTDFQKKIWTLLLDIPFGETASYMDQAKRYGNIKAIRAIANANGKNKISIIVPCHRVIGSDGSLTGYGGGIDRKRRLLDLESKNPTLF